MRSPHHLDGFLLLVLEEFRSYGAYRALELATAFDTVGLQPWGEFWWSYPMTIALTRPTVELFASWTEAVAEFGGVHIAGSGLNPPVLGEPSVLDLLIEKARSFADTTWTPPEDLVHNDLYWITDDDEVVGFMSIRHELNDFLRKIGGHIGYAVRPSRRRRGYARAGLALALERCRELGIERVLVTCDDDNVASYRTIEGAGGVLEDVVESPEKGAPAKRRYWIEL